MIKKMRDLRIHKFKRIYDKSSEKFRININKKLEHPSFFFI